MNQYVLHIFELTKDVPNLLLETRKSKYRSNRVSVNAHHRAQRIFTELTLSKTNEGEVDINSDIMHGSKVMDPGPILSLNSIHLRFTCFSDLH
ncbi:hypothetical protein ACFX2J_011851 [Malus domestica]